MLDSIIRISYCFWHHSLVYPLYNIIFWYREVMDLLSLFYYSILFIERNVRIYVAFHNLKIYTLIELCYLQTDPIKKKYNATRAISTYFLNCRTFSTKRKMQTGNALGKLRKSMAVFRFFHFFRFSPLLLLERFSFRHEMQSRGASVALDRNREKRNGAV